MVLAIVIDDSHLIAMVAVVPSMISAAVGWVAWQTNKHARVAANSVRPNGQGTVIEITEEILSSQRTTHSAVQTLQMQQLAHEAHDDRRFDDLTERIGRCEARHGNGAA